jgi:hypothetical protein
MSLTITVQRPHSDRLQNFLTYLKVRAVAPEHETNRDVIANFVDKFLVFELKRLGDVQETFEEEVSIPDSILVEPLKRAKAGFDKVFKDFMSKQGLDTLTTSVEPEEAVEPESDYPSVAGIIAGVTKTTQPITEAASSEDGIIPPVEPPSKRNGNGHKTAKKRKLTDQEKDQVREFFLLKSGMIGDDDCVVHHKAMDQTVTIFQVTGFCTYLHKKVAMGDLTLTNLPGYIAWMQTRRDLWSQYDSPKYKAMREAKSKAIQHQP